jgi:phosphoribosyl 1,2-cyclic phosphodiesterase
MFIKCWGSRGAIPVSGKEFLKYGGDTSCVEILTKSGDTIILDAGTGIRRLGNLMLKENRLKCHLIITHPHWDHLMGLPFFKPLYEDQARIYLSMAPFNKTFIEKTIAKFMTPPYFPVNFAGLKNNLFIEDDNPSEFEIGSVNIVSIPISHTNQGRGYKFIEDGKVFVFITDNELGYTHRTGVLYEEYLKFTTNADLLFHDAEYTPDEYKNQIIWGHSAYTDVIRLAIEAGVKKIGMFHLNQERTDEDMDDIVAICRKKIAEQEANIDCFAVASDMTFTL